MTRYGLVAKSYKNNILICLGEFYSGIGKNIKKDICYLTPFTCTRDTNNNIKINNKNDIDVFREKYKLSRNIKFLTETKFNKIIFTTPRLYNLTEKKFISPLPSRKKYTLSNQTHVCLVFDYPDPCRRNMLLEHSIQYGYKFVVFSLFQRLYLRLCGVPFSSITILNNQILDFLTENTDLDIGLCCLPEDSGELLILLKFWRRSGFNINNKYNMFIPFL